jgi:hypothetical protein
MTNALDREVAPKMEDRRWSLEDGAGGLGRDIRIAGPKAGFGVRDLPERVVEVKPAIVGHRLGRSDSHRSESGASTDTNP